ncbi:MAG: signal peptidase I [Anaerolineae bacterium]|nr:signal peptidase I [Anaerolineae bacterium]
MEPNLSPEGPQPRLSRRGRWIKELLQTLLMIVAIYTLLNLALPRYMVEGRSMEPNFHDGQRLFVSRLAYMFDAPGRGDVVVIRNPRLAGGEDLIKRVIGLPGETVTIELGRVFINGAAIDEPYVAALPGYSGEFALGPDEYFVLGDNRGNSNDSFDFGPIKRDIIVGRAWISYWPLQWLGIIPDQSYTVDQH